MRLISAGFSGNPVSVTRLPVAELTQVGAMPLWSQTHSVTRAWFVKFCVSVEIEGLIGLFGNPYSGHHLCFSGGHNR